MHADSGPLKTWQQTVKTKIQRVQDQLVQGRAYDKGQKAESEDRPHKTPRACGASWRVPLRIEIDRSVTGQDGGRTSIAGVAVSAILQLYVCRESELPRRDVYGYLFVCRTNRATFECGGVPVWLQSDKDEMKGKGAGAHMK